MDELIQKLKLKGKLKEVKAALDDAEAWIRVIIKKVQEENPQFSLPFR